MAIRFRKSIKVAPGLRINVGKTGASCTFGARGASVNVSKQGVYANTGLPGTGLSQRTRVGSSSRGSTISSDKPGNASQPYMDLNVKIELNDDGALVFRDGEGHRLSEELIAVTKKQQGDALRILIEKKQNEINSEIESLGLLYIHTPSPDKKPKYRPTLFSESKPLAPTMVKPNFFQKFFESQKNKIEIKNQEALQKFNKDMGAWNARSQEHQEAENKMKKLIEVEIYEDECAMQKYFEEALQDIFWPRETLISVEILNKGSLVYIDVDLPEIEDMPQRKAKAATRILKLDLKDMSDTEIRKLYMKHIHAIAFRIVGEAFSVLPVAEEVIISGFSQRVDKATGDINDEYLFSFKVPRITWSQINFKKLNDVDVVEAFSNFDMQRTMTKTGVFKPIIPFKIKNNAENI